MATEKGSTAKIAEDEVYCRSCGEPIKEAAVICPNCGVEKKTKETGPDSRIGLNGYVVLGVVSALIALLFVPIVFGVVSIFSGFQIYRKWNEYWGIGIMILGSVCMAIGVVLGILTWI